MRIFHQIHNSQGNYNYNVFIYNNINYAHHFHKNYEVIYVIKGEVFCSVSDKQHILTEGDFALCLSNEIHSVRSIDDSQVWIGVFSEDFVHEFKNRLGNRTGVDFKFRCSEPTKAFLLQNLIRPELSDILMIKSCLYALCSEYLANISLTQRDSKRGAFMADIVEYIEANYKKPITLKELATHLGYDYCYLSKSFKQLFSMPFNDYLNTFRTDCALTLLTQTNMPITEIAFESGFQSIRSFNYVFKKQTGHSPAEFRKRDR